MANFKSISHRCHLILVAFVWELTKETIYLPLGCLQGGMGGQSDGVPVTRPTNAWRPPLPDPSTPLLLLYSRYRS